MRVDHGNYIGGASGIDPGTRRIIVRELRALADKADLEPFYGADDYERGCHTGEQTVIRRLRARADEIESAGASQILTRADVRANPEHWLRGPGVGLAEKAQCPHGYRLTDTCPMCDADDEKD